MGCWSSKLAYCYRYWPLQATELTGAERRSLLQWLRSGGQPGAAPGAGGGVAGPPLKFEGLTKLDLGEHFLIANDVTNSDGEEVEEEVFDSMAWQAFVQGVLPQLADLRDLSLKGNELFAHEAGGRAATALVEAMQASGPLGQCQALTFAGNSLGSALPEQAQGFLQGLPPQLLRLDLSENQLHRLGSSEAGAESLWKALGRGCPELAALSLARNNLRLLSSISAEGAEERAWHAMAEGLTFLPGLTALDLSENELDGAPAALLAKIVLPQLPKLEALDLSGNGPRDGRTAWMGEESRHLVLAAVSSGCDVHF